jgi:hypothetical protein
MRGQENMKRLHVLCSSPDRASLTAISYNRGNSPADPEPVGMAGGIRTAHAEEEYAF